MVLLSISDHLSSSIGTKKPDPKGVRTKRKEKAMFRTGRANNCMMCKPIDILCQWCYYPNQII